MHKYILYKHIYLLLNIHVKLRSDANSFKVCYIHAVNNHLIYCTVLI